MVARIPLLLAVLLLAALAPAAHAAFPGRNGDLAYGWDEADEPELGPFHYVKAIRLVAPRGGEPRTVVGCEQTVPAAEPLPTTGCLTQTFASPAFAPDGRRIAFDNGASIALVDRDGGDVRLLPAQSEDDGEPAFSPTGRRLAFSTGAPPAPLPLERTGIWVRAVDGGAARQVSARGTAPAWSSRNWIAFARDRQIWRVRPNGRGLHRLTRRGGSAPAWSPHGTRLAFVRRHAILVLDLTTGRLRTVERRVGAVDLAWSPDGRRLAYTLFDGGVETIRTDGRAPRRLVAGGVGATYRLSAVGVDWAPLR